MIDIHSNVGQPHREFWEAGHLVFGLHGVTPEGLCKCGDPDCKAVLKHPLVSNWQHTPHWSEEQLEVMEMTGQFDTGYGVLLRDGLLVVDVDARNSGLQAYDKLLEKIPSVAASGLIVNTGSGGGSRHLFFKAPPGMALMTKHPDYPGIDFKNGASYVVGPGSIHASGRKYEIVYGSPDDIQDAPEELIALLKKPERHRADMGNRMVGVSHADLADMVSYVDGYDDYDVWVRVGMALHHASGGTAIEVWDKWSQQSAKYKDSEIVTKWHSFGKGANPVTLGTLAHYAEQGGWQQPVAFTPDVEFAELEQTIGWREPEMRFLGNRGIPAPTLPLELLVVAPLAEALRNVANAKGAPVDYIFAALLTSASALLSNYIVASPKPGWDEPAVLWAMIVGEPSASKSPAFDAVITVLKSIERDVNGRERKAIDDWEEKEKVYQSILKKWQKDLDDAVKAGDPVPAKPENPQSDKRPQPSRLMVNDITIERLAQIISGQEIGILQFRDELAGWLEGMVRYTKGGSDRGFWLEAYGARPFTVDRMTRQVTVDRLAVCVLGGIQPDRMNTLLLGADDDGLLARLMPIWPDPAPITVGTVSYDDSLLRTVLYGLHGYVSSVVHTGRREPSIVRFNGQSHMKLEELRQRLRDMENEEEGLTKSFLGKVSGLTVRVALVLAYINAAASGADFPLELSEPNFEAAQSFTMDYVLPMVRRSYEVASISKTECAARKILWISKVNRLEVLTVREIKRRSRTGLDDDKDIYPALSLLVAADWLKEEPSPKGKNGRPTVKYYVNPRLWED